MERLQRRVDDLEDADDRSAATMLALLSSEDWDFVVDASTAIAQSGGKAIGDLPTRGKEGTFSFIKLINVAAGLRSLELHDTDPALAEELFVASRDVATTWAASPESPSYYCAELVANAYGRTFTRAEMTPPEAGGGLRWEEIREPDWAGTLVRRLERRVDQLDDPDDRAGARLLSLLVAKEWEFLVGFRHRHRDVGRQGPRRRARRPARPRDVQPGRARGGAARPGTPRPSSGPSRPRRPGIRRPPRPRHPANAVDCVRPRRRGSEHTVSGAAALTTIGA